MTKRAASTIEDRRRGEIDRKRMLPKMEGDIPTRNNAVEAAQEGGGTSPDGPCDPADQSCRYGRKIRGVAGLSFCSSPPLAGRGGDLSTRGGGGLAESEGAFSRQLRLAERAPLTPEFCAKGRANTDLSPEHRTGRGFFF